jgi:MOSC domain-containing protein YiiM
VSAGDRVEVIERPDHDVSVALVAHIFLHERSRSAELLAARGLPGQWRAWAQDLSTRTR